MIYCVNPWCPSRTNDDHAEFCSACQLPLLIHQRFKLLRPLSNLSNESRNEVFEVVDTTGSSTVAIRSLRILKVCKSADEDVIRLFEREAETLQLLDHPAIPRSYLDDYFEIAIPQYPRTLRCIALDKFEGLTLDDWMQRHGPISQRLALDWLGQLAKILEYINDEGYFHRDIKPSNILLRPDGTIALIDFGTVRQMTDTYFARISYGAQQPLTRVESFGFSAPEQLIGKAVPQSDFYSLGQTFIVLLTGKYFHELEINPRTGRLQWESSAKSLDRPFVKFINDLTHPSVSRRPKNSAELLSIIFDALPRKLKWYSFRKNKLVRFTAITSLVVLSIGLLKIGILVEASRAFSKGRDATNAGLYLEAIAQLRWSIRLNPSTPAYLQLGYVCKLSDDKLCAETNFKAAIKLDPHSVSPYQNLGVLYEDEGDLDKAVSIYQQSIAASKGLEPVSMLNLARVYLLKNNITEANKLIAQAKPLADKNPYLQSRLFKNQAWGHWSEGNFTAAKAAIDRAIELDRTYASPHCLAAQIHEALKLNSDDQWTQCMSIDSEDTRFPEVRQWRSIFIRRGLSVHY